MPSHFQSNQRDAEASAKLINDSVSPSNTTQ
jgi:hypothetical protein